MNAKQRRKHKKQRELINVGRSAVAKIQAVEARAALLAGEREQLLSQFLATRNTKRTLQEQLDEALAEVERLTHVVAGLNNDCSVREQMIFDRDQQIKALHEVAACSKRMYEDVLTKVRDELQQRLDELRSITDGEIAPRDRKIAELEAELKPFRKRLKAKSDEISKLQTMLSEHRTRIATLSRGLFFDASKETHSDGP